MAGLPAILGGKALSERPLHIVRPKFPPLSAFAERFETAMRTGAVTNHGPHVREFESRLARHMGVPHALAASSGQAALMLMLRAAGIDSGEVIVPSFTFSATAHAVRWCGAEPVFADISPDGSMTLDPADAERRVTPRTKAILPVCVYGIACDYAAFDDVAKRHGLRILYDSAPAFGTRVRGRPIGGFGHAQAFSFHATKAFATMEGGCLATRDDGIAARAAALRNFGQTGGGPDCDEAGLNGKMTEVCALIGIEQLATIDTDARRRVAVAARYRAGLSRIPGLSFATPPADEDPVWLYFPVVVDAARFGLDRERVFTALAAENLHVRKYFGLPCHHMTSYASQRAVRLPRTEHVAYNVVALPVYNDMTDAECDLFVEAFARLHEHAAAVRARLPEGGA
jgi:dTDP-4-amino-4,6-dideoxygalactose transaminase